MDSSVAVDGSGSPDLVAEGLDQLDQGISVFDAALRLVFANRRFRELLDLPEELARPGILFADIVRFNAERGEYGAGDPDEHVRQRVELVNLGQGHVFERMRPDGSVLEIQGQPLSGGGFVTTYTDVTRNRRAERSGRDAELRFKSLIELSPNAIVVHQDDKVVYANPAAAQMIGVAARSDLIDRPVMDLLHPDYRRPSEKRMRAIEEGRDLPLVELRVLREDGGVVDVEGVIGRTVFAGKPALQTVLRDNSRRKRAEARLRRNLRDQEILGAILEVSLRPAPLADILDEVLSLVLISHGMGLLTQGCIFVTEPETGDLVMAAQQGLSAPILEACARIAPGTCLCGQAAETGRLIHAARAGHVEGGQGIRCEGMLDHGHYCVPIHSEDRILGVLNLHIPAGHQRDTEEERFVTNVAEALAGVIERKHAEEARNRSEEWFRAVADSASDAVVLVDGENVVQFWNPAAERVFGWKAGEIVGKDLTKIMPKRYRAPHRGGLKRLAGRKAAPRVLGEALELHGLHRNGHEFPLELTISRFEVGGQVYFSGIMRDVSQRRQVEQKLRELSQAVEQSPASVVITDVEGDITYVNRRFCEITGWRPDEVIGRNPRLLKSGRNHPTLYEEMWRTITGGREWRGELQNRKRDGSFFWEQASISPIKAADGSITHFLAVKEDISVRKDYEKRLVQQANYDELTGLPNRGLAMDRLNQALVRARRDRSMVALMFIDLDDFKKVNDSLGHAAGDELLKEAASRLQACLREGDTVARMGGDEFTVILPDFRAAIDAEQVAEKILKACSTAFVVENQEVYIAASIGITVFPTDQTDPEALMRNADAAMYRAKQEGRNTFRFFTPEMNAHALEHMRMEALMRHALEKDEFVLHFQPLISNVSGKLVGAEALLRWENEELGTVPPDKFIHLAEDTGLIVPIGAWVIERACLAAASWETEGDEAPFVAVNVSSKQFQKNTLVNVVKRALEKSGLPPERLELEITESVLLADNDEVTKIIEELSALGIGFAIDDFGTGYSSLSYLRRFPFDTLKIDRSFIKDMIDNEDDAGLVRSIIAMAQSMRLQIVGEGIENASQHAFLQDSGADLSQGWLFGKAMPADEFDRFIAERDKGD